MPQLTLPWMITARDFLRIESDVIDTIVSLYVKGVLEVSMRRDEGRDMQGHILPKRTRVRRELHQRAAKMSKAVVKKKRGWTE